MGEPTLKMDHSSCGAIVTAIQTGVAPIKAREWCRDQKADQVGRSQRSKSVRSFESAAVTKKPATHEQNASSTSSERREEASLMG